MGRFRQLERPSSFWLAGGNRSGFLPFWLVAHHGCSATGPRRQLLPGSPKQDAARPVAEGRTRLDGGTAQNLFLLGAHRHRQSVTPRLVLRHTLELALAVSLVGEVRRREFLPRYLPCPRLDVIGACHGGPHGENYLNRGLHGYRCRGVGGASGGQNGARGRPREKRRSLRRAGVLAGGRFL
jgi:hypothetical protein